MGERQVDVHVREVVEEKKYGWRRKIRGKKNRNFSLDGSRRRTKPRMEMGK